VSLRAPGSDSFWISPFSYFDESRPEHVVRVGFDLEVLEGDWRPSPALEFHCRIYGARPDVNAIVHHHGASVTTVSTTGRAVGMYNVDAALFADEQAILEEDGIHPPADGRRIVSALGSRSVLLIRNHGAIVVGPTLERATVCAFTLERVARMHLDAVAAGGSELAPAYVEATKPLMLEYFVPETWEACVRRARLTDPELFSSEER
jgi:L-fuculose-phosphate aldolase